ncbi:hypothetical protein EV44_g4025 [Erysiphe necator]|uniref:Uncharacterized protein n=1 Tax=Uncinula necator TaxID=52586 RepID=A0A0B1P5Q4_UNCNE|nr:hypothetical protein EV44_g4025 [Erysiphe necator]
MAFGFVDDTNLVAWGCSARENCYTLKLAHSKCLAWAKRYGAEFAPGKYQLIHFSRKRGSSEDLKEKIELEDITINPRSEIKVLGVLVDSRLRWTHTLYFATYLTENRITLLIFNSRYLGNETMAPLANKHTLPPEPPDAGNRVSKTKKSSSKSVADVKSIRLAAYSAEAFRKAEAIEKALRVSQCSTEEIIGTEDNIMYEEMSDASDSVFGGGTQRAAIPQCQTETHNPLL